MTEESQKKVYDFIKGNILNAIVILTSLIYVFYGMIAIERTDLSIESQVAGTLIGIITGLIIKQNLGEDGFNKAYRSNIWLDNLKKYKDCCNTANQYIERIDNFYYTEEMEKKRNYRRTLLMSNQLRYEWFFDNKGNYIENDRKLNRKQKNAIRKCLNVKIYNLNLFSEYSIEAIADTKKEITDKDQRARMFGKNSFTAIITAVIGMYFTGMLTGWNWGQFIADLIQVAIWISCGITQLYTNYNYVVIEKTNKLTRKMELIIKFKSGCERGLYLTNPYDMEETNEKVLDKTDSISSI